MPKNQAKSSTERSRLYREKNRNNPEYKAKVCADSKKYRENNKAKTNESARLRMRKLREKRKAKAAEAAAALATSSYLMYVPNKDTPFKSRQAEGKAWKKMCASLPTSPNKKKYLLAKASNNEGVPTTYKSKTKKKELSAIEKMVKDFYHREDISRVCPGMKDVRTVRDEEGKRTKVARRVLQFTLNEAHAIFLSENPENSICRSKFCQLRPTDVFLSSTAEQIVCACVIHENAQFLCDSAGFGSSEAFIEEHLCTVPKEECRQMLCDECPIKNNCVPFVHPSYTLKKWISGNMETLTLTTEQFKTEFKEKMIKFGEHLYLKRVQSRALKSDKDMLKPGEVLIQCDFAENYSIKFRVEPMEFHWANTQGVAIFTAVVYYRQSDNQLVSKSYAVVSDCTKNTTLEMANCISKILTDLINKDINYSKLVKIWSDGAGKHFKNRYVCAFISLFDELFGVAGEWNFSESYHGKGPMDGVGGCLKHTVYRAIVRGQAIVQTAMDFFLTAKQLCPNIELLYLSAESMDNFHSRFFDGVKEATGILKCRRIKPVRPFVLEFYRTSMDDEKMFVRNIAPATEQNDDQSHSSASSSMDISTPGSADIPTTSSTDIPTPSSEEIAVTHTKGIPTTSSTDTPTPSSADIPTPSSKDIPTSSSNENQLPSRIGDKSDCESSDSDEEILLKHEQENIRALHALSATVESIRASKKKTLL